MEAENANQVEKVQLGADESARIDKLQEIFDGDRHGDVDGVYMDLRHGDLPAAEWFCPILGNISCITNWNNDLPLLWFPWFDLYYADGRRLIRCDSNAADVKLNAQQKCTSQRYFGDNLAEYLLKRNDKIAIHNVERYTVPVDFEHIDDSEIRFAYLSIISENGDCHQPPTPIVFRRRTSVMFSCDDRNFIRNIMLRMFEHFRIDEDGIEQEIDHDGSFACFAFDEASRYLRLKAEIFEENGSPSRPEIAVAKMAYLWGKAEAEINIKPLARRAVTVNENNQKGGTNSGAARRQKAEESWIPVAKQLAVAIRRESPELSQDDVVYEIQDRWEAKRQQLLHSVRPADREKIKKLELCKHARLKQLISAMEKAGEIPRRKVEEKKVPAAKPKNGWDLVG